jgi:hypothetical protein
MKPLNLKKKYSVKDCEQCKHLIACNCTIVGCTHFKLIDERIDDLVKGTN